MTQKRHDGFTFRKAAALVWMAVTFHWQVNNIPLVQVMAEIGGLKGVLAFTTGASFLGFLSFGIGLAIGWPEDDS